LALDDHRRDDLDRHRVLARACGATERRQLFGYFLSSLIFFPAALIVACMVSDRTAIA
jgi:hypothetical protein